MKVHSASDRDVVVVLLGESRVLTSYLGDLKRSNLPVECVQAPDDHLSRTLRSHARAVLVLGEGISVSTKDLTAIRAVCTPKTVLVSADGRVESMGAVRVTQLLPWSDVASFVIEVHRRFDVSALGRIEHARRALDEVSDRAWYANALLMCPCTIDDAAASLSSSRAGIIRRMRQHGATWHVLSDRLALDVYEHHVSTGDVKLTAIAAELRCASAGELTRRVRRIRESRLRSAIEPSPPPL